MFQIIFNELSAAEMSALPKMLQLDLLAEFQIMPEDLDNLDTKNFGVIERKGKKLYRSITPKFFVSRLSSPPA